MVDTPTVDDILLECTLHVGIGLGKGRSLDKKAFAYLRDEFRPRLQRGIDSGADWNRLRAGAHAMCELLGRQAAKQANARGIVGITGVRKAAAALERACPTPSGAAAPRGRACPTIQG